MKIDPASLDPRAIPTAFPGLMVRDTRWGWVIQRKPGWRKRPWTPAQLEARQRFALAARMAANPQPLEYATAVEMSKGTEQVPRDILTMAAMGLYYTPISQDGTAWTKPPGATIPQEPTDEGPDVPEPEPQDQTPPLDGYDGWRDAWNVDTDAAGNVTAWPDRSPSGRHATPSVGAEPVLDATATPTGRPALRFSGAQHLVASYTATAPALTRFWVGQIDGSTGQAVFDGTMSIRRAYLGATGATAANLRLFRDSWGPVLTAPPYPFGIHCVVFAPQIMRAMTPDGTDVHSTNPALTHSGLTIGARWDKQLPMTGTLAEILDYPWHLSDEEIAQVFAYLTQRWFE